MSMCSPIDGAIFNLQRRLRRAFGWLAAWAAAGCFYVCCKLCTIIDVFS